MQFPDDPLDFPDGQENSLSLAQTPAQRRSQLASRQTYQQPVVLTPDEEAVVEAQQMQLLTIAARERTQKTATETKAELFLHTNSVFAECVDQTVDLKDSILNPEKQRLFAQFAQRMIDRLPETLERSFDIAQDEIDRVTAVDLSTQVRPPRAADVYIPVKFLDWLAGGMYVNSRGQTRRNQNRR